MYHSFLAYILSSANHLLLRKILIHCLLEFPLPIMYLLYRILFLRYPLLRCPHNMYPLLSILFSDILSQVSSSQVSS
jgi:hypothetical protein